MIDAASHPDADLIAQVEALAPDIRDAMMAHARAAIADLRQTLSNLRGWEVPPRHFIFSALEE